MRNPDRRQVIGWASAAVAASQFPAMAQESLSLTEKVGRMLLLGFIGSRPDTGGADIIADHLSERRIGGVLFLRHNVRSREGAEGLAARFRGIDPKAWMAIDQEGGLVQRLSRDLGYSWIPRASQVVDERGIDGARELYALAAREFREAGFNLNLAPVADLHDPENAVIGRHGRSYGTTGQDVAAYARTFIEAFEAEGSVCVIKHFPGHGHSRGDSHDGFVDISETWSEEELDPFRRLVEDDVVRCIMGGHLINRDLDPSGLPATFSSAMIDDLLRARLEFKGVVMTDDLDMAAIRENYEQREAVLRSIEAGNDIIMLSNSARPDPELPQRIVGWVEEAIEQGRFDEARIDRSVARIAAMRK